MKDSERRSASCRRWRKRRQKLSFPGKDAVGKQGMSVGMEVGAVGPEGLQRDDAAGADVTAFQARLEGFQNRRIGGLGQEAEQLAVAFDETAQDPGDGKGPVAMQDGGQDLGGEFLGKQERAFGLAAASHRSGRQVCPTAACPRHRSRLLFPYGLPHLALSIHWV
jgi:hypothetical protein